MIYIKKIFFYYTVFLNQPKCISKLVNRRVSILEKIFIDSPNLQFNSWFTHLGLIKESLIQL